MSNPALCINCGTRPRFSNHLFCGRTCAGAHAAASPVVVQAPVQQQPVQPVYIAPPAVQAPAPASGSGCMMPGCTRPPYQIGAHFCSKGHRDQAATMGITGPPPPPKPAPGIGGFFGQQAPPVYGGPPPPQSAPLDPTKACLECAARPKRGTDHFCSQQCIINAQKRAPCLIPVPNNHETFKSVADQFTKKWKGTAPKVRFVYKIMSPQSSMDAYDKYRAQLEARGNFVGQGRSAGNECRRWHATRRDCNLGDSPSNITFCSITTCALCNIIRTSFKMQFAAGGLFGTGIYTSATSSKSDTYQRSVKASPYKAMMLNKVAVGRGYKLTAFNPSIAGPPAGYDSVIGNVANDELIVYKEDAVRPSWLLIYG